MHMPFQNNREEKVYLADTTDVRGRRVRTSVLIIKSQGQTGEFNPKSSKPVIFGEGISLETL